MLLYLGTQDGAVGVLRTGDAGLPARLGPDGDLRRALPIPVDQPYVAARERAGKGGLDGEGGLANASLVLPMVTITL